MELNICHLYPDILNLYGDRGNIITMKRRLEGRGIEVFNRLSPFATLSSARGNPGTIYIQFLFRRYENEAAGDCGSP